jgi:phosphoketolase
VTSIAAYGGPALNSGVVSIYVDWFARTDRGFDSERPECYRRAKSVAIQHAADKPVIFAFHGYPWLIHRLTYRRTNHGNLHVRGYKEEGTTTTPFDMTVLNDLDRYHLAGDVVDRVRRLGNVAAHFKQLLRDKLIEHRQYIIRHGEDMPEIRNWKWSR